MNRKKVLVSLGIILVLLFWYFTIKTSKTFAIKLSYNSIISDEFSVKIKNLINQEEKIAYLTFDDGPTKITSKVLEILKNENVKATFFVIGKCVDEYPEIVRRAYEEGHYIANHGYDHDNSILYKNEESFINEIKDC